MRPRAILQRVRCAFLILALASCNAEGLPDPDLDMGAPLPDLGLGDGNMLTCTLPRVCARGWVKQCYDTFNTVGFYFTSDGQYFPCERVFQCSEAVASSDAWCDRR